jgi:hypothetical protein
MQKTQKVNITCVFPVKNFRLLKMSTTKMTFATEPDEFEKSEVLRGALGHDARPPFVSVSVYSPL